MTKCAICDAAIETYRYVRVKQLVRESRRAKRLMSAPSEQHGFYCLRHTPAELAAAIVRDFGKRYPIRMLWNPSRNDWHTKRRDERITLQLGKVATPRIVAAVAVEEDRLAGVDVNRASQAQSNGLRGVVVHGADNVPAALAALLMVEGSPING